MPDAVFCQTRRLIFDKTPQRGWDLGGLQVELEESQVMRDETITAEQQANAAERNVLVKNKPVQLELFGAEQQANAVEETVPSAPKLQETEECSEKSSTDIRPEPISDVSSPPQTTAEESEIEKRIGMLYEAAIEQGSAEAQYELGCAYEDGRGVEQDTNEATRWYVMAAKQGHSASKEALFNLFMFLLERGDPSDEVEAFHCLRKAAELGFVEAQVALGYRYAHGHGLPQDDDEAAHWNRKAAEQGSAEAQFELGCAYENGWGVEQDTTEAIRWYAMATKQGHVAAKHELKRLKEDLCRWALTWRPRGD